MIAIDTNVLARHLAEDDPDQTALTRQLLGTLTEEEPGFVSQTVIVELYWLLRRSFRLPKPVVESIFDGLMATAELEIEDGEAVGEALEAARQGADFADALIHATSRIYGVAETVTFDRDAAERFGWRLLG